MCTSTRVYAGTSQPKPRGKTHKTRASPDPEPSLNSGAAVYSASVFGADVDDILNDPLAVKLGLASPSPSGNRMRGCACCQFLQAGRGEQSEVVTSWMAWEGMHAIPSHSVHKAVFVFLFYLFPTFTPLSILP